MSDMEKDICERLREAPTVTLPQSQAMLPVASVIRRMMVERTEAADEIELLKERNQILGRACEEVASATYDVSLCRIIANKALEKEAALTKAEGKS